MHTTASVEYDGVVLAPSTRACCSCAYRHHKTVGAIEAEALDPLGILAGADGVEEDPPTFMVAMGWHRHWDRPPGGRGWWPR